MNRFRSRDATDFTVRKAKTRITTPTNPAKTTDWVSAPTTKLAMAANPMVPMMASPGRRGMLACSSAASIIWVLPRSAATPSALEAARRSSENLAKIPFAFFSPP